MMFVKQWILLALNVSNKHDTGSFDNELGRD